MFVWAPKLWEEIQNPFKFPSPFALGSRVVHMRGEVVAKFYNVRWCLPYLMTLVRIKRYVLYLIMYRLWLKCWHGRWYVLVLMDPLFHLGSSNHDKAQKVISIVHTLSFLFLFPLCLMGSASVNSHVVWML